MGNGTTGKMNGLPYYKAYPRDFFGGTVGMDAGTKGIYRLVLDLIYMHGGMLADDPRYISGMVGCSVKAWNIAKCKLLEAGKLVLIENSLTNLRAISELEMLAKFQEKQRKNRVGSNENNELSNSMDAPPRVNTEPDTYTLSLPLPSPPELRIVAPADPLPGEGEDFPSEEFLGALRAAVGLTAGAGSRYWHGPGLVAYVRKWRNDLGLEPGQIIDAARMSRAKHVDPPKGPKALDGWMATARTALVASAAIAGARVQPVGSREASIQFWAKHIMDGLPGAAAHVSPDRAREMLARGLVTPEALRSAGVAA